MKIFSANLTKEADNYTIKNEPIKSIDLMERAATKCTKKIFEIYSGINEVSIFAGPGNNGGDGLAIARLLSDKNINVYVYILQFTDNFSEDFKINLSRLQDNKAINIFYLKGDDDFPTINKKSIIIDAIFGSGLSRELSGLPKNIIEKMNMLQNDIISIDIPSGLFGEENINKDKLAVEAKHTITFQYPFLSFMFPENEKYVGKFHVVDIGISKDFINKTQTKFYYIQKEDVQLKKRTKFSHKGTYGNAILFAGSYGMAGASVLANRAAHRVGVGLLTAAIPKCNRNILQISSPETILQIDKSNKYLSKLPNLEKYNSLAIGPGIGFQTKTVDLLKNIIKTFHKPIIFDADAITILSKNKDFLKHIPKNSIFTPHPKEFERLVGKWNNDFERLELQINFAKKYNVIVILKGANTSVAIPNGDVYFNSTGNPGMATAGSGDVLTGVLLSLLAQNYKPKEVAIFGTFLHGLAGDLAKAKYGEHALIASDIIEYLPEAIKTCS